MYSAAINFPVRLPSISARPNRRQSGRSPHGGSPPATAPTCHRSPNFCCELLRRSRPAAAKRSSPCLVTTSIHGRMKKVRLSMYSTGQKTEANARATLRELAPRELAHCCLQETKGDVEKAAALLGRRARG